MKFNFDHQILLVIKHLHQNLFLHDQLVVSQYELQQLALQKVDVILQMLNLDIG